MIETPGHRSLLRSFVLIVAAFAALGLLAPDAGAKHTTHIESHWTTGDGEALSWILVQGDGENLSGSGESRDFEIAKSLARRDEHNFLVIRMDGKRYVVRDDAMVDRAMKVVEPSQMLGQEQGRLGRKQGELGRRQGDLGRKQGELGRRQAALGREQARLNARMVLDDRRDSNREYQRRQDEIEREMQEIQEQQEQLGRLQEDLGREQEPLGRQQEELGRQQEKVSRQMEGEMRQLIEDAIRDGKADSIR